MNKLPLIFLLITTTFIAKAQTDSAAYNRYADLNLAVLEGRQNDADELLELIIPDTARLPATTRTNFYNIAARMYENGQSVKAITYYERVAAAVPDYYVAHRALGFLYLKEAESTRKKLNTSMGNKQYNEAYIKAIKKALPHLEKAQACDPSPETLAVITSLYKNIEDTAGLDSLDARLAQAQQKCIDILDVQ
ncbi:MAG: hypothetical protein EOP47_16620 [Sphingobacteriaceae bacterium]|nr:MAG: hypothetical protein EOP47_16620 [Sphingobacteriaceae bacterium]